MMTLWINVLFMPVCAALSGFVLWITVGREPREDRELFRNFVFLLVLCMLCYWGTVNTDTVRMHTDPVYRMQTELDAHPVYAAFKRVSPDATKQLHEFLEEKMLAGETLPQAFLQARNLLTSMTNERMGFADQKTRIQWGIVTLQTLRDLEARNPETCYQLMAGQPLDQQTLSLGFSEANQHAFQAAVIAIYESADRGMRHLNTPGDVPVEFNDAARQYHVIKESIADQFGKPVADALSKKPLLPNPVEAPEQLCAARIAQLETMLAEPQAMAATLVDSVLR